MLNLIFILFPALVAGHGLMVSPEPRIGKNARSTLQSPKLSPWATYTEAIKECGDADPNQQAGKTADRGATVNAPIMAAGSSQAITYDIRLGHGSPKNHVRIAMRYYTKRAGTTTTTTQFADNILFESQDSDADRAADRSPTFDTYLTTGIHTETITIPSTAPAGFAEIQWIWASERDGAGGYYITCADVQIGAANVGPVATQSPTVANTANTPTSSPTNYMGSGVFCYETDFSGSSKQTLCKDAADNRCMTTYVNGEYYFRCAAEAYCLDVIEGAKSEGISGGETFSSGLTYAACCKTNNCNTQAIVRIPGQSKASRSTASVAIILLVTLALLF